MTTKTITKTITAKTSELRSGDVVLAHGMRLLIDLPLVQSTAHDDARGPVLFTQALVLNRDEVPNRIVPIAWTREWNRSGPSNDEHRWTVQGNDLALWTVERELPLFDVDSPNPLEASIARARVDEIEPASERVPAVHEFESTSFAYDMSQCDDEINDGDVLVVRSERAVAIMLEAWPTAPEPELSGEHFHVATPDLDFAHVESVSKPGLFLNYSDSLAIARRIADELRRA